MTTAALIEKENKEIARQYKELLRISYQTLSKEDKKLIRSAFDVAVDAHKNQRRKSGEAYIFHPIAVAKIVASEIGLDATSIASALLHDVVEDTEYTLDDIERLFGESVAVCHPSRTLRVFHIVARLSCLAVLLRRAQVFATAQCDLGLQNVRAGGSRLFFLGHCRWQQRRHGDYRDECSEHLRLRVLRLRRMIKRQGTAG